MYVKPKYIQVIHFMKPFINLDLLLSPLFANIIWINFFNLFLKVCIEIIVQMGGGGIFLKFNNTLEYKAHIENASPMDANVKEEN